MQDLVELRIDIAPWNASETAKFIDSAIEHTGCNVTLFTDDALIAIHEVTNGVPARVVSLSSHSLLAARAQDQMLVTREYVEAAASELLPRGEHVPANHFSPSAQWLGKRRSESASSFGR